MINIPITGKYNGRLWSEPREIRLRDLDRLLSQHALNGGADLPFIEREGLCIKDAPTRQHMPMNPDGRRLAAWIDTPAVGSQGSSCRSEEGAIFRRLIGQNRVGDRLHADIVADIYKRVARWIGMAAKQVNQVSGHSVRVGAPQDLLALNIDLASIMQAGRWKSSRMPMRYGEEILAARGGMARAAKQQGRD